MKETKMILKMDQEKYQLKIQALIEKEKRDVNVNFKMGAKGMCLSTTYNKLH